MLSYKYAVICWAGEQLMIQSGLQCQHDLQFWVMYKKSWRPLPRILSIVPEHHICTWVCVGVSTNSECSAWGRKTELNCHSNKQEYTNPKHQITTVTTFCTVVPNINESSLWNSFQVTLLAPRTFGQLLDFWNICATMLTLCRNVNILHRHSLTWD
jgi:hypothetical protein